MNNKKMFKIVDKYSDNEKIQSFINNGDKYYYKVDNKYADNVKMIKKLIDDSFSKFRITYYYDRYTERCYFKLYCYTNDYIFKIVPDMKWEIIKSNIENCLKKHNYFVFRQHKDDDDNDLSFWQDYCESKYYDYLYDERNEDDDDEIVSNICYHGKTSNDEYLDNLTFPENPFD